MAGGTLAPGRSSRTTKCEAHYSHVERSRSCELTSLALLPTTRADFSYCFTGGRPNVDLFSMQSHQPLPPAPRGAVGLAQLLGTRLIIDVEHVRINNMP